MKREGGRLGYYTDTIVSHDESYLKARSYFKDVIELCSEEPSDRESLKWDMRLSDWDKGSNTPCVNRNTRNTRIMMNNDSDQSSFHSIFGDGEHVNNSTHHLNKGNNVSSQKADTIKKVKSEKICGGPDDWPMLRCRAYLGLSILDQEGFGKVYIF